MAALIERLLRAAPPLAPPTDAQRREAYLDRLRNAGQSQDEERLLRQAAGRHVMQKVRRRERALLRLRARRERRGAM